MSTDIVKFEGPNGGPGPKVFQLDALKLFVYICVPLMALTFAAWGAMYKLESWRAEKQKKRTAEKDACEA
jgi:hypothetical protein